MNEELVLLKKQIRKEKIAMRRALDPDVRKRRSEVICRKIIKSDFYRKAEVIMIYNAMPGEVMLDVLEQDAALSGKTLCYPLCTDKIHMTAFSPEHENAFKTGAYGIKEPDPSESSEIPPENIDLVIVPCTAFDETCGRIGMGAGYYDRYLGKCTKAYTAAAAFEIQKTDQVPADEFDKSLDAVVSEDTVYYRK